MKALPKIFSVLFLITVLSAFASATLSVDMSETFATGDPVTLTGTCTDASSVAFQVASGPSTVLVDQERTDLSDGSFSAQFSLSEGGYFLYVSCDSVVQERSFCVGDGCTAPALPSSGGSPSSSSSSSSSGSSSGGSSGGSGSSRRSSGSGSGGGSAASCSPSWTCGDWGPCDGQFERRNCLDINACGTTSLRPALSRVCESEESTVPVVVQETQTPNQQAPARPNQQFAFFSWLSGFWAAYSLWVLLILVFLVLLVLILLAIEHFREEHKPAINNDQLDTYVREETHAGLSEELIRKNLQRSGWTDREISESFDRLQLVN